MASACQTYQPCHTIWPYFAQRNKREKYYYRGRIVITASGGSVLRILITLWNVLGATLTRISGAPRISTNPVFDPDPLAEITSQISINWNKNRNWTTNWNWTKNRNWTRNWNWTNNRNWTKNRNWTTNWNWNKNRNYTKGPNWTKNSNEKNNRNWYKSVNWTTKSNWTKNRNWIKY